MNKSNDAYKTIGEVAKILRLKINKKGALPTHTIRFWEKQFKQIKPKILNANRRYYDQNSINLLKKIKFLLKTRGLTIKGAKYFLENDNSLDLDEKSNQTINNTKKEILKKNNYLL